MRHFKLFPAAMVLFISIVFVFASNLSAAETVWDDFNGNPALKIGSHFIQFFRNGTQIGVGDLAELNTFNISCLTNSVQWYWEQDQPRRQDIFPDILLYETLYTVPDVPLMLRMNFGASTWDGKMPPNSNPADGVISSYDSDYIKSMRIPAPTSLVLVAIGLLSLRYIRQLRY
jgi:hypothetical protein